MEAVPTMVLPEHSTGPLCSERLSLACNCSPWLQRLPALRSQGRCNRSCWPRLGLVTALADAGLGTTLASRSGAARPAWATGLNTDVSPSSSTEGPSFPPASVSLCATGSTCLQCMVKHNQKAPARLPKAGSRGERAGSSSRLLSCPVGQPLMEGTCALCASAPSLTLLPASRLPALLPRSPRWCPLPSPWPSSPS